MHVAADPEQPCVEVAGLLEGDLDGPEEDVPDLFGVLPHHGRELGIERFGVRRQALVVVRPELDGEYVRHHASAAVHDCGPVVALALECRRDLDRLDLSLEGAREGAVDDPVQPLLETIENAHSGTSSRSYVGLRLRRSGVVSYPVGRRVRLLLIVDRAPVCGASSQVGGTSAPCTLGHSLARVAE